MSKNKEEEEYKTTVNLQQKKTVQSSLVSDGQDVNDFKLISL